MAKANKVKWEVAFTLTDVVEDGEKAVSKKELLTAVKNIQLPAGVTGGKFSVTADKPLVDENGSVIMKVFHATTAAGAGLKG